MMNQKYVKVALATLFAGLGLFLFLRALNPARSSPFPPEHEEYHARVETDGAETEPVRTWEYVTPTAETLDNLVQEAVYQAGFSADKLIGNQRLDSDKREKLTKILSERLKILLRPTFDFDEYEEWIASRGGTTRYKKLLASDPKKAAAYKHAIEGQAFSFRLLPFAVDSVEVLPRYLNGVLIPWDPPDRPPVTTMWRNPPAFPISNDAVKAGLTVYEVRVPMILPAVELEPGTMNIIDDEARIPGILGIAYAWSEELNDWLPWRMWEYCVKCDDTEHYMGPNSP